MENIAKKRKTNSCDGKEEKRGSKIDEARLKELIALLSHEKEVLLRHCQQRDSDDIFFIQTFDPESQFEEALQFLTRFGFVCLAEMVSAEKTRKMREKVDVWLHALQRGIVIGDWKTFVNKNMQDNYCSGLLDGIAPPNIDSVRKEDAADDEGQDGDYESIMTFAKSTGTMIGENNGLRAETVREGEQKTEIVCASRSKTCVVSSAVEKVAKNAFSVGLVKKGSILCKQGIQDVHARSAKEEETNQFKTVTPIYSVAAESPLYKKGKEDGDEISLESTTIRDFRFRFDSLSHSQEAWDIRTDVRMYKFFHRLLQSGNNLLVSIDRFIYQRPLKMRPTALAEDWKNNHEKRPMWEQNPYWRGDPALSTVPSGSIDKKDGSYFMTQTCKRPRKPKGMQEIVDPCRPFLPFFTGYQGILALEDMVEQGGAVVLVPSFHTIYEEYAKSKAFEWSKVVENVVRADGDDEETQSLMLNNGIPVGIRKGTFLVYDKRIPRWGSANRSSNVPTVAMFISMWPKNALFEQAYRRVRALSVRYGIRCTAMRHLTGHSATAPRWKTANSKDCYAGYEMPCFTELGLCLLGVRDYSAELLQQIFF